MQSIRSLASQTLHRDGHLVIPAIEFLGTIYNVDVTESLEKGFTVIQGINYVNLTPTEQMLILEGVDSTFHYDHGQYDVDNSTGFPCSMRINDSEGDHYLELFGKPMDVEDVNMREMPYSGTYVAGLQMDRALTTFALNQSSGVMYGLDWQETLYAYDLSAILK